MSARTLLDLCRYHVLRGRLEHGDRLYTVRPFSTMWRVQRSLIVDDIARCITRIVTDHSEGR